MGYEAALAKAWSPLTKGARDTESVRVLGDEYTVDFSAKRVSSVSCAIPAKDFISILVLHYLAKRRSGIPPVTGEWISFRELDGGDGYYTAFKKRVLDRIVKKYGAHPEALPEKTPILNARKASFKDISVIIDVFDGVPVLVTLQAGDEEFDPEAHLFFDRSIKEILCTEDVAVMADLVVSWL